MAVDRNRRSAVARTLSAPPRPPGLVINGRLLSGEGLLARTKSLVDVKPLSPSNAYLDDHTGKPTVANARQKKVNAD